MTEDSVDAELQETVARIRRIRRRERLALGAGIAALVALGVVGDAALVPLLSSPFRRDEHYATVGGAYQAYREDNARGRLYFIPWILGAFAGAALARRLWPREDVHDV